MIESSGKEKESGMERTNEIYQAYVQILKEELLPAMGCTEPVAIAYAAAKAREALGELRKRYWYRRAAVLLRMLKV